MISVPQQHYNKLLQLVKMMHGNMSILLSSQHKPTLNKLFEEFTQLNTNMRNAIDLVSKESQKQKIVMLQYESQLNLVRHKYQTQLQTIKSSQGELTKLRQQLSKAQKQTSKLKDINKQLKQQLINKENSIKDIQEQVKVQIKSIKRQYKEENKQLKERVKKLQGLLATAIITNKNQQVQEELDKELEELKQYQLQ